MNTSEAKGKTEEVKRNADLSELEAAGFVSVRRSPKRLIANIQGLQKSGKTRLALTARKPIGYIAVEIGGDEGVVDQFIPDGEDSFDGIQIVKIRMDDPAYPNRDEFKTDKDYDAAVSEAIQNAASPAIDSFCAAYYASLHSMATTIVDTGSDLWEILRLANFGRLEKVPQLAYGQLNKSMDKLLDDAFSYAGSTIFIHHMKELWTNVMDEKSGKMRGQASGEFGMAGYGGVKKKVQATIELWREDLLEPDEKTGMLVRFNGQIVDSRHAAVSMGQRFTGEFDFADIGMAIMKSKRSDWE